MTDETTQREGSLDPRVYFAAQRTLLAWVRTGLALMGFGFVVARFGLFLRELATVSKVLPHEQSSLSLWVGTSLVIFGVAIIVAAAFNHWVVIRRLERGEMLRFRLWSLEMIVAFLLALIGLLIAIYLIFGLAPAG